MGVWTVTFSLPSPFKPFLPLSQSPCAVLNYAVCRRLRQRQVTTASGTPPAPPFSSTHVLVQTNRHRFSAGRRVCNESGQVTNYRQELFPPFCHVPSPSLNLSLKGICHSATLSNKGFVLTPSLVSTLCPGGRQSWRRFPSFGISRENATPLYTRPL